MYCRVCGEPIEKILVDGIQGWVARAYEAGHTHGENTHRMQEGDPPEMVYVAWQHCADRILSLVAVHGCHKQDYD